MFKFTKFDIPALIIVACFFIPFFSMPPFVDDVARYSYGYIGLASQGRFLTELYYILLNSAGKLITPDIYQLNIVISFILMFFSVRYFCNRHFESSIIAKTTLICVMICSPFYLENMSYHVDIIGMSASYSFAILASLTYNFKHSSTVRLILLLVASFFYQTSFAVFAGLIVAQCLGSSLNKKNQKENFSYLLKSIIIFSITFAIVQGCTSLFSTDKYVDNHTTLVHLNETGWHSFLFNIKTIFLLLTSLSNVQLVIIGIAILVSVSLCVFKGIQSILLKRYFDFFIFLIAIPVSFSLLFMPYALFENAIISARVLMSFPVFITVILWPLFYIKTSYVKGVVISFAAFYLFLTVSLSSIYVNAFQYESQYKIRKLNSIVDFLENDSTGNSAAKVNFINEPRLPHYLSQIYMDYPILLEIVKFKLTSSWFMNAYFWYAGINAEAVKEPPPQINPVKENRYYTIYKNNGIYIVRFK